MRRSILARGPLSWICSWPRSSSAMRASSVSAMLHTIPVTRQSSFNDPDDWKGCLSWRMLTNTSTCDTTKCKTCREINSLIWHQEMKRQTTSTTSFTLRGKKWKTIFYASCCNFDAKWSCASHGEEVTVQFEIFFRVRLIDWMWLTRCLMHLEEKWTSYFLVMLFKKSLCRW